MPPRRWSLFLDESGAPEREDGEPVVCGLLVLEDAYPGFPGALREALARAAPEVPWPIHAWLTRKPILYAIWPLVRAAGRMDALPPRAAEAIGAADVHAKDALARVTAAVRAGADPEAADVDALDRVLRLRAPAARAWLWARAVETRAAIGRVLEGLARAGAEVAFVAAGEGAPGDAMPEGDTGDRYLELLACAAGRAADALAARGGEHRVDLYALARRVTVAALPEPVRSHVRELASAAARGTSPGRVRERAGARVRLNPAAVQDFDARVHPALVLADFASNAAWRALASRDRLERLLTEIEDRLRIPAASGHDGLPYVAATGAAWKYVERARGNGRPLPDPAPLEAPGVRAWAREQAIRWANELA